MTVMIFPILLKGSCNMCLGRNELKQNELNAHRCWFYTVRLGYMKVEIITAGILKSRVIYRYLIFIFLQAGGASTNFFFFK